MSASNEMLSAWRRIFKDADFAVQPIWRTPKWEPLSFPSAEQPIDCAPLRCWEFRRREIFDEREKRAGTVVFGRLSTDSEWTPLDDLPRHITVGDFI